jgi:DNA-directed RNA polymerase specialized sigma24 family protein
LTVDPRADQYAYPTLVPDSSGPFSAAREGNLPRGIAPIIAGVLALAIPECDASGAVALDVDAESESLRPGYSRGGIASRRAHRSTRSTSRRTPSCELSANHVAGLHAFVLRRVPDPADAADIAQQALLLACSDHAGGRVANVDAWLRCIARNLIIDHFRAGNRHSSVELRDALADAEPVLQTRPDLAIAIRDCRQRIRRLLDEGRGRLCLVHQISLLLSDVYGHCDKHSAAVLWMSVPCYKLVLHRARSAVRAGRTEQPHPSGWLGVSCRLSTAQLVALRSELLEDLMT